jgi:hypothetical protein
MAIWHMPPGRPAVTRYWAVGRCWQEVGHAPLEPRYGGRTSPPWEGAYARPIARSYVHAGEALQMITRTPNYRDSPHLEPVAAQLRDIGSRDPNPALRTHTRVARINELIDADLYQEVLDTLPEWRSEDEGVHNAVVFDGLEIVAQLHTRKIDEALDGIAEILDLKPYGQHLLVFTHEALKKVAKALHENIPTAGDDAERLQNALDLVLARYYQLGPPDQAPGRPGLARISG